MRGCVNIVRTLFREVVPKWIQIQRCWNVRFYLGCLCVSCVSLGTLKLPIMLLLKFMLLEYWEEGGWGCLNQTLVKVMFQWKEPTMPVLIPPPPPRSDPIPWLVELCGGRGQEARLVPILSPALGSPELLDYLPISTNCAGRH